jgi:hypothetical protein
MYLKVPLSNSIIDGSRTHKSYIGPRWHCTRAIDKICLVRPRDAENAEVSHRRCESCIPLACLISSVTIASFQDVYGVRLTLTVDETLEDLSDSGVGV